MTTLTAADYADTGQWRLRVNILTTGLSAFLENTLHDDVDPQELFSVAWEENPDALLQNIENAVYDHPRVLDDFSAVVTVFAPRTALMPTALLQDEEGAELDFYTALYNGKDSDVMIDSDGDVTAAYSLVPGLKGFLYRTFPGARMECRLMANVRKAREMDTEMHMLVDIREKECDFILADGTKLISGSTHPCNCGADIAYHVFNILQAYGVNPMDTKIFTTGRPLPEDATRVIAMHTKP